MSQGFANAVYYPQWRVYKGFPPSALNVSQASHVLYAFVGVNEDGTLRPLDDWADNSVDVDDEKGCLAALAKLKRNNPHLRTLLSVGGASASAEFPALAANPEARETFARACRAFVDEHEMDGIDIDWEHPKDPTEGHDFLHLLYTLRTQLPGPQYLVTTALPPGAWVLRNINLSQAAAYLDYLNLMAYDLTGPWTDVAGHQAQLFPPGGDGGASYPETCRADCNSGVDYCLENGFPLNKILLGIPAYARYFPGAPGLGHPFEDAGEIDYCDFPDEWVADAQVDHDAAAAWYDDPEKGFVSFDSPASVRQKARYVRDRGLGGLMYWTGAADRPGPESLVSAGFLGLHGYGEE
ncbi:glycoside hydrolase family 18 protein [Sodiomyces alcalophilus JCM 7366]|uniref:glycoside hydrolase family 18 protein n=1 Tax=Sodiomyces alcalophilus JCM 7366 TaxID=591952 RepID=UPI0039B5C226